MERQCFKECIKESESLFSEMNFREQSNLNNNLDEDDEDDLVDRAQLNEDYGTAHMYLGDSYLSSDDGIVGTVLTSQNLTKFIFDIFCCRILCLFWSSSIQAKLRLLKLKNYIRRYIYVNVCRILIPIHLFMEMFLFLLIDQAKKYLKRSGMEDVLRECKNRHRTAVRCRRSDIEQHQQLLKQLHSTSHNDTRTVEKVVRRAFEHASSVHGPMVC